MPPASPSPLPVDPGWEIFQKIRNSEGERIFWEQEGLRATYFVFSQNFGALRAMIKGYEDPKNSARFSGTDKRELSKLLQMENMRHLHNFLAGAVTLTDHSRRLVDRLYKGQPFFDEYQNKVKETFADSGSAKLVQGLRNWMVHKGLVPVMIVSTLEPTGEIVTSVELDIKQLRSHDGWTAPAKALLASSTANPRLLQLVESYHDQVECFYSWLGDRMSQIHAVAFKDLAELQEQYLRVHPLR